MTHETGLTQQFLVGGDQREVEEQIQQYPTDAEIFTNGYIKADILETDTERNALVLCPFTGFGWEDPNTVSAYLRRMGFNTVVVRDTNVSVDFLLDELDLSDFQVIFLASHGSPIGFVTGERVSRFRSRAKYSEAIERSEIYETWVGGIGKEGWRLFDKQYYSIAVPGLVAMIDGSFPNDSVFYSSACSMAAWEGQEYDLIANAFVDTLFHLGLSCFIGWTGTVNTFVASATSNLFLRVLSLVEGFSIPDVYRTAPYPTNWVDPVHPNETILTYIENPSVDIEELILWEWEPDDSVSGGDDNSGTTNTPSQDLIDLGPFVVRGHEQIPTLQIIGFHFREDGTYKNIVFVESDDAYYYYGSSYGLWQVTDGSIYIRSSANDPWEIGSFATVDSYYDLLSRGDIIQVTVAGTY